MPKLLDLFSCAGGLALRELLADVEIGGREIDHLKA